uniref:chloride channel protein n=1 Tax=Streptococcus hillyeri TaxID=2282420 RepID=UPI003F6DF806
MLKGIKDGNDLTLKETFLTCLLALFIGVLVGVIDTIFGKGLLLISEIRTEHFFYLIPFLGISGLLIVFLYRTFGGQAKRGMALIFEVGQGKDEQIPLILVPLIVVTTWLTHLFGGSAGREGVAVQIGATISHFFSRYIVFEKSSPLFLTMGMAAGFAGLFQTPMAALFFALEVLVIEQLRVRFVLPTILASFTAAWTSNSLGLEKFTHLIESDLRLDFLTFVKLAVAGLIFGLVGNGFAASLSWTKEKMAELVKNPYHRIFCVGILLSLMLFLCHEGRYSGLGTNLIEASFSGGTITSYDWLLKIMLTVLTLSLGFQGGEVTPLFSIGASLGVVLAGVFQLPLEIVAASGYIAVFASATNTILAPIFIGGEVFGFENTPFFLVAVAFSYSVNRKHSIYTSQKVVVLE